ncbi:MAG: hypothetical protein AB1405_16015, partial [Bdellovibrionota bacterium]
TGFRKMNAGWKPPAEAVVAAAVGAEALPAETGTGVAVAAPLAGAGNPPASRTTSKARRGKLLRAFVF